MKDVIAGNLTLKILIIIIEITNLFKIIIYRKNNIKSVAANIK